MSQKLNDGDRYWYIRRNDRGQLAITDGIFRPLSVTSIHDHRWDHGNCYRARNDARYALKAIKFSQS